MQSYIVRKLADGNCWMAQPLTLQLTAGTKVTGAYNTSATPYDFIPESCSQDGNCALNGNTFSLASYSTYYYNWYAATAGTGTPSDAGVDAPASICPVGWRLPPNYSISEAKSYQNLTNVYGYTNGGNYSTIDYRAYLARFPLSFALYGFARYGAVEQYGTYAGYQSSSAWNVGASYYFYFDGTYTWPQYANMKPYGLTVRCVAL